VSLALKARIARYLEDCDYTREAASDEAARYSGHSGRVGMYTAPSEAGIAMEAVATLARHKSLNVVQKYTRRADQTRALQEPRAGNQRSLAMGHFRSTLKRGRNASLPSTEQVCQLRPEQMQQRACTSDFSFTLLTPLALHARSPALLRIERIDACL